MLKDYGAEKEMPFTDMSGAWSFTVPAGWRIADFNENGHVFAKEGEKDSMTVLLAEASKPDYPQKVVEGLQKGYVKQFAKYNAVALDDVTTETINGITFYKYTLKVVENDVINYMTEYVAFGDNMVFQFIDVMQEQNKVSDDFMALLNTLKLQ